MPRTCIAFLVLEIGMSLSPSSSFGESSGPHTPSSREQTVRRVASYVGLVGGIGVAGVCTVGFGLLGSETMITQGAPAGRVVLDIVPSFAVFAGATWLASRAFVEAFVRLEVNRWLSVPVGAAFGGAAGVAIGVLGFTTMFAIGQPLGIMAIGDMGFGEVVYYSVLAGALWGGLSGLIPGAILGPAISFPLGY